MHKIEQLEVTTRKEANDARDGKGQRDTDYNTGDAQQDTDK